VPRDSSPKITGENTVRLLLVLVFIIWSNSFTAIKHLKEIFSPVELILARFLPVMIFSISYLFSRKRNRSEFLEILRAAPIKLTAMGLFSIAGYNYFLYVGQSEIKPGAAALITTASPIFTLILAIVTLREKVPLRRIIGIVLAFIGLYFVIRWGKVGLGNITGISNAELRYALITALAPLSWALYTIIGKSLSRRATPLSITYGSLLIGTIPFLLIIDADFLSRFLQMRPTHWLALFHLSALSTILCFWLWNLALHHLPATSVASFIFLNPPFAAFFGWLLYDEEVTLLFLVGSAIVLFGLRLTQSGKDDSIGVK